MHELAAVERITRDKIDEDQEDIEQTESEGCEIQRLEPARTGCGTTIGHAGDDHHDA